MKITNRVWGLVALLVLLSPLAAFAQKSARAQGPFHDVQIVVKDLATGQEIGSVQPGGSVTLTEGQKVRLILTAYHPGQGKGPYYPETVFTETEPGRGWVRVTRTSQENSSATVEIVRPGNNNRNMTEALNYRITENVGIPNDLRQGSILIRVEPLSASSGTGTYYPGNGTATGNYTAQDLTNMLYRGILLRDMDSSGQPYVDRIARGGYPELVKVAEEMARSEESRVRVYENGVSREQRLLTLYQTLLGLSQSQIDQNQWRTDLSRLAAGRIDQIVSDMVRSQRFQDAHDLSWDRTAIRY
ncbi:MAG TPA: hypothetical protein VH394_15815 [Thermoanaerobaculia bacterium]|jgi:hypothetical protein|nr:hypothetical protein [Thermoanaerobaculia bacterium]